jgi:hypothetical protein
MAQRPAVPAGVAPAVSRYSSLLTSHLSPVTSHLSPVTSHLSLLTIILRW